MSHIPEHWDHVKQGETWVRPFEAEVPDEAEITDFSGWSAYMSIARDRGATPIVALTSDPNGGITLSDDDLLVTVVLTPAQSASLPVTKEGEPLYADLWLVPPPPDDDQSIPVLDLFLEVEGRVTVVGGQS